MHKIYENNDLLMYVTKRYCHLCGKELQRKRSERIVHEGDPDHKEYCSVGKTYNPYGDILVIGQEYYCPHCCTSFTCEQQNMIIKAQEFYRKKVVTEAEIQQVQANEIITAIQNIKKARWLLLIPFIGGLACSIGIFNGKLQTRTQSSDATKLLFASVGAAICIAVVMKAVSAMFAGNDFITQYGNIIIAASAALAYNLPVLLYIHHRIL